MQTDQATHLTQSSVTKNKRGKAFWQNHIASYLAGSYKSKAAYCRELALRYENFLYWYRRLKQPVIKHQKLIPVKLSKLSDSSALCSIELKEGQRLWIHNESALCMVLDRLS